MKIIKSVDTNDYSIWLVQYPDQGYCVGYSTLTTTKLTNLLSYLSDAMEVFSGLHDYLETGGDLQ
jgi:hypothetical protein